MYRPPKARKEYDKLQKDKNYTEKCVFCSSNRHKILKENQHFYVTENIFPYTIWDHFGVAEHLLLVPKRHVEGVAELTDSESKSYMKLLREYEKQDYNYFARAPVNEKKTVAHQHTHLIKVDKREKNFLIYVKRPHIHWHD